MGSYIINRRTARQTFRFFDACYRQGVLDAYNIDDEEKCKDFVNRMKSPKKFSLLYVDYDMTWQEWRAILFRWCITERLIIFADEVLNRIKTYSGYLSVFLPIAMDFYCKGILDFVAYPNPTKIVKFKSTKRIYWKTFTKISAMEFVSDVQLFSFERIRIDATDEDNGLNKTNYESFCHVVWAASKPLPQIPKGLSKKKKKRRNNEQTK